MGQYAYSCFNHFHPCTELLPHSNVHIEPTLPAQLQVQSEADAGVEAQQYHFISQLPETKAHIHAYLTHSQFSEPVSCSSLFSTQPPSTGSLLIYLNGCGHIPDRSATRSAF